MYNTRSRQSDGAGRFRGFTLVEILVVLALIAILIGLLLPVIGRARARAKQVGCASNLRQVGTSLLIYANNSRGWVVPVGAWDGTRFQSLGNNVPPYRRWPAVTFRFPVLPVFPINDPSVYCPSLMVCPADEQPANAHSYILNKHLVEDPQNIKKYGSPIGHGRSVADVALAGEKLAPMLDYYMEREPSEPTEFNRIVDRYKHGTTSGSNYLYLDLHCANQVPSQVPGAVDPWDVTAPNDR